MSPDLDRRQAWGQRGPPGREARLPGDRRCAGLPGEPGDAASLLVRCASPPLPSTGGAGGGVRTPKSAILCVPRRRGRGPAPSGRWVAAHPWPPPIRAPWRPASRGRPPICSLLLRGAGVADLGGAGPSPLRHRPVARGLPEAAVCRLVGAAPHSEAPGKPASTSEPPGALQRLRWGGANASKGSAGPGVRRGPPRAAGLWLLHPSGL